MTIRRLIELGANLDDEITIEARTYDVEGNRKDTFYNFDGVDIGVDFDIDKIILKADVESVTY
jgi:hypothetical protein